MSGFGENRRVVLLSKHRTIIEKSKINSMFASHFVSPLSPAYTSVKFSDTLLGVANITTVAHGRRAVRGGNDAVSQGMRHRSVEFSDTMLWLR